MRLEKIILSSVFVLGLVGCGRTHHAPSIMDEIDPKDPSAEQLLDLLDREQEEATGQPSHIDADPSAAFTGCRRSECKIWARVDKSEQRLHLFIDGKERIVWKVSTGKPGYETPDFDRHPNGRIYNKYTSSHYPEGDYNGLGNMPYSVFIEGGYAIHGTPDYNWSVLGQAQSKGCVRLYPDNAEIFVKLVRKVGVSQVWITVER